MIDRKWLGHEWGPSVLEIERGRLKRFAAAIGETDPVYFDVAAAREAGYTDLPAPSTFLFAAEFDSGVTERMLRDLQIPFERLLHGEQGFIYHRCACAGDTITATSKITDLYEKKSGALQFLVRTTEAHNQRGEPVAELRTVLVVRAA